MGEGLQPVNEGLLRELASLRRQLQRIQNTAPVLGLNRTVATSIAYQAVSGDYVLATGNITITLPTLKAGRIVGVKAMDARTAAAPVNVVQSGGGIVGPGVSTSGVSPLFLGIQHAHVTLLCDGTQWHVIEGEQDTNWHLVGGAGEPGFANSWANGGGGYSPLRFRKRAQMVTIDGLITNPNVLGAVGAVFTLPAGYLPDATEAFDSWRSNGATLLVEILVGGNVNFPASPVAPGSVSFTGFHFYQTA